MNIVKKIILFIKSIFIKQDEIKKIEEPKIDLNEKTRILIEDLKVTTTKKRVQTLICFGDGLGIQKKITY